MKTHPFALLCLLSIALLVAGCGHLDTTPAPTGDRVLNGSLNFRPVAPLPTDAVATVRLLDESRPDQPAQVLAEQTLSGAGTPPLAFKLDYKAEDIQPPKRVRIEARVSSGSKLFFYTATAHAVTPANAESPFVLWLDTARR
ncbi:MAG: YbaY family lipoprotein [Opitutae bacterium]|nr:YbaY family lipoprotein [Opitutae bacterium]